ncbi:MAG: hypothetical protein IK055_04750 [Lachnospiraceae bacterium]|nr:hypothetical protein [Lachnospiraceae bacterium]
MSSTKKKTKLKKKRSVVGILFSLIGKVASKAMKLFLLVLKVLPFASMCVDRFGKKESTS